MMHYTRRPETTQGQKRQFPDPDQQTPEMAKGKHKTISKRNQNTGATSEPSSPTTASPEYTNAPENQEPVLKSYLMKIIESLRRISITC